MVVGYTEKDRIFHLPFLVRSGFGWINQYSSETV